MPSKHRKYASKPSRREPRRGSPSAGPRQQGHARQYERPHPRRTDGRDLESEVDNSYRGTTSLTSSAGGPDENVVAHGDSMMEPAPTEHGMLPYSDGNGLNNIWVVSHLGTYPSGSTIHPPSSDRRDDCPLPYGSPSKNTHSGSWGSSATDGAVDDQYASPGAQDLRANDNSGQGGLYIAGTGSYRVFRDGHYSSAGSYVGNEYPESTDAIAGVDMNQPAQTTADHSSPSSVYANMGSAQVSPVVQQGGFNGPVEVTTTMDRTPHWIVPAREGPWNPHDAVQRYH
ncbi:hypothetical protein DL769_000431 [Monosporascus sp. CRB-8-3]|nr:hypothetical protein DL769_000431 [Monosporascus sp. CRB-8-3]